MLFSQIEVKTPRSSAVRSIRALSGVGGGLGGSTVQSRFSESELVEDSGEKWDVCRVC